MKIKTNELTGAALDWAVAKCEGGEWESADSFLAYHEPGDMNYSTDWSQGGPIIEREKINVEFETNDTSEEPWAAWRRCTRFRFGPTPLIAAMRCYVASKLGDEVEIPEELT